MTYTAPRRRSQLTFLTGIFAFVLSMSACDRHEDVPHDAHAPAANAEHDAHARVGAGAAHDAHADHAAPVLPAGERWDTDAPLRAAMTRIGDAVEQHEPAYADGKLTAENAQALAERVEADVRYMIENCRLAPEPDAALHVLIARMMSAASALKSNPSSPDGIPQLVSVLNNYRATFDHAEEHATHG